MRSVQVMRAVVTGGGGFLGSRLCTLLQAAGHEVLAVGRGDYPHLRQLGIACARADIRDAGAIERCCADRDVVFHTAAVAGIWGPTRLFRDINVEGTRHVLEACRRQGVGRLVYTSSPSVVFGEEDLCGVDERQPYPPSYIADYPATKAEAERLVLAANGPQLRTVSLRPHLIWGPGDPHLIPRVVERARRGRLRQIGDGCNLVDVIYIDNAAAVHLQAAQALACNPACAGRAYFVSQGQPVALWPWLNEILAALGVPRVERRVSYDTARRAGAALERLYRVLRLRREPPMTRFLAAQLAKSHYFDISAARRDLGYQPGVSTSEGLQRMLAAMAGC